MPPILDVVIPVLNEAKTLESQIMKLQNFLAEHSNLNFVYQIIIADNGSTDDTLKIAHNLASVSQRIRVVSVGVPGVGLALRTAWATSNSEYIGYMDLDFSTELIHLADVEKIFNEKYDCVFGSRLLPESRVKGRTFKREITSRVFNSVIKSVFNSSVSDAMCGFKFLRREKLRDALRHGAGCDGWFFCAELTVTSQIAGHRIYDLPVFWQDAPGSKVRILTLTTRYIADILRFRKRVKLIHKTL